MTMKEQERKALEKIKKIVEDLGEQSYIGTAFAGCFDLEAWGHEHGVVKTKLKSRPWVNWGKCPWITYQDETQKFSLKVKSGTWNVRTGAGTNYKVVCIVKGGDIYPASKITNGWYFIDSLNGWISPKAVDLM